MTGLLRLLIGLTLTAGAGWWLFADTVRHHLPTGAGDNVIRFSHWGGYGEYLMWQDVVGQFNQVEPDVHVKLEYVVGFRYATKIQQQIIANTAPDVMLFQDEPFPHFAPDNFADLGEYLGRDGIDLRRDYHATAVDSFIVSNVVRGMPCFGGNVLIYCNLDCFEAASRHHGREIRLPDADWTLDDFVALAKDLTFDADGDGRIDQFGFALPSWIYSLPFFWAHGMAVLDESRTRWAMTGPEAERAWQWYQDLRFVHHVSPLPVEQAELNTDAAFFTGRVAMCVTGPWVQPFLSATTLRDRYRIVDAPIGPGGRATRVTWDALRIDDRLSPARKALAWRFVRFVCTQPGQDIIARYQRSVPALKASAATFVEHDRGVGSHRFIDAMAYARMQPISPYWNEMDRTIGRHMSDLLDEAGPRSTPAEFLAALADDPVIVQCFGGRP